MNKSTNSDLIALAANRASSRPFYLGSAFADFQQMRHMSDAELADYVGCQPDKLRALRLCRRPDVDSARFRPDVRSISDRFDIDPLPLIQLLREVAFRDASRLIVREQSAGFLIAARDKPKQPRRRRDGNKRDRK